MESVKSPSYGYLSIFFTAHDFFPIIRYLDYVQDLKYNYAPGTQRGHKGSPQGGLTLRIMLPQSLPQCHVQPGIPYHL